MHILTSVYHGLYGFARTVKESMTSRFRGKKTEVVERPVPKIPQTTSSDFDTHQSPVASKGYLLAKELSDQSLPAHKISSIELPPRFPYVETRDKSKVTPASPSRARKILTALIPGNTTVPKNSDIAIKQAKRWQTRRLRKGLQTIKRATGLDVSIRHFDHRAAVLRDFLTDSGAAPGYHEIKVFCDKVKRVMAEADALPGLIKLAVTEYMMVLSDLGQAAQFKALGQRQQLAERFLPGHDGFKAHCLRKKIDPDSVLSLQYLNQFQGKLMGWQDEQGYWHPGLVDSLELGSLQALKDRLEAELDIFIGQIGEVAPDPRQPPLDHDQLQAEVARLYAEHGVKKLPNEKHNPVTRSSAEQHPVLQSRVKYQVKPSGSLQYHSVVPLEKARLHYWVFEQQLADLKARHARLDHELDSLEQALRQVTAQNTPETLDDIHARTQQIRKRKANTFSPPLPTLILRNSKEQRIDTDFMKKPELADQNFTLYAERCQTDDYRQINQALLKTPGFESKEVLDTFKDRMKHFRNQCCQYAIGNTLPGKVLSENDSQLIYDSQQRINKAMAVVLENPEAPGAIQTFHYLRMQEAVLEKFLKMNDMI